MKAFLRPLVKPFKRVWQELRNPSYPDSSELFLSVDLWIQFADLVVDDESSHSEVLRTVRKAAEPTLFFDSGVVFAYLDLLSGIRKPFRILTAGNDDICVPLGTVPCEDPGRVQAAGLVLDNPFLFGWYTKNPCLTHPKLVPLPLGPKWQWRTQRFFGEPKGEHLSLFRSAGTRPLERFRNTDGSKDKLLYFNFGDTTGEPFFRRHSGFRAQAKGQLVSRFPWNDSQPYADYLETLGQHRFCLSPPGRGIDTHRTWEALLVGTVPIVASTPLDSLFTDLPVLVLDDWSVLTPEYLDHCYRELQSRDYCFDICYSPYWKERLARPFRRQTP